MKIPVVCLALALLPSLHASPVGDAALARNDVNHDGYADLVIERSDVDRIDFWAGTSSPFSFSGSGGLLHDPPGAAIAAVDFNSDGYADLLFQNFFGTLSIAYVGGDGALAGTTVTLDKKIAPATWFPVGAGDFDCDDHPDILFRDGFGHLMVVGLSAGPTPTFEWIGTFEFNYNPTWTPFAVADMDADGCADVLFKSPTGEIRIWFLNAQGRDFGWFVDGVQRWSWNPPALLANTFAPSGWSPVAVADYTGDNKPDILFQSTDGLELILWPMDGVTRGTPLRRTPTGWAQEGPHSTPY